jgi:3-hydroxybutyryl-CoA dehydratase
MMSNLEVGAEVPPVEKSITQEMINAWAEVSGDGNPLHVDPEYAKTTRFGGTIAHGHISLGFLCEMMVRWLGPEWYSRGALRGMKFVAPIRPGYTVRAQGSLVEVTVEGEARVARCDVSVINTASEETCVVGGATFRFDG